MASLEASRTLMALAGWTFLALAAPCTSVAQSTLEPRRDRERQIVDEVQQEQSRNGPHSEALIGPLTALALMYQEDGDRVPAAATIERVLELIRVNDGLYSLEQVSFIRQLITIEESFGNPAAVSNLETRLLTLARRHPDDLRTVPVLRDAAEKRVEILERYEAGDSLVCASGLLELGRCGSSASGSRSAIAEGIAMDAVRLYAEAIGVLVRNRRYSSPELRALDAALLDTVASREDELSCLCAVSLDEEGGRSWTAALGEITRIEVPNPTGLALMPGPPGTGRTYIDLLGRESLERQFAYELAGPAALSAQIEAFLRIADWDLLHRRNALASDEYDQVYRLLAERNARGAIDELFSPELPVVLPAHRPNPLATAATDAYIDVAFEITRFGDSRKIEVRAATPSVTAADKEALVTLIKRSKFRPRSQHRKPARASPVVVHYYVNE